MEVRVFSRLGWFVLTLSLTVFHSYLLPSFIFSFLPFLPPSFSPLSPSTSPFLSYIIQIKKSGLEFSTHADCCILYMLCVLLPCHMSSLSCLYHHRNLNNICDGSYLLFILQDLDSSSRQTSGYVCEFLLLG